MQSTMMGSTRNWAVPCGLCGLGLLLIVGGQTIDLPGDARTLAKRPAQPANSLGVTSNRPTPSAVDDLAGPRPNRSVLRNPPIKIAASAHANGDDEGLQSSADWDIPHPQGPSPELDLWRQQPAWPTETVQVEPIVPQPEGNGEPPQLHREAGPVPESSEPLALEVAPIPETELPPLDLDPPAINVSQDTVAHPTPSSHEPQFDAHPSQISQSGTEPERIYFPIPDFDREQLTYQGVKFAEYRQAVLCELDPRERLTNISAITLFGRNGYGPEAAAVLLHILDSYPTPMTFGDGLDDERPSARSDAELMAACYSGLMEIGKPAEPVLLQAAQHAQQSAQGIALMLLARSHSKSAVEVVISEFSAGDPLLRQVFIDSLDQCSPTVRQRIERHCQQHPENVADLLLSRTLDSDTKRRVLNLYDADAIPDVIANTLERMHQDGISRELGPQISTLLQARQ